MPKKIAIFAALAALALAPALAQTTSQNPSSPGTGTPPAVAPMSPSGSMAQTFIDAQSSEQWLATKLIGVSVTGPDKQKIGSINDLLFDQNGTIQAAVVGVGGFLGIGEKNVAISFKSLNLTRTSEGDKAALQVSKTELEKAPDFKPYVQLRPAAQPIRPQGMPGSGPRPQGGL